MKKEQSETEIQTKKNRQYAIKSTNQFAVKDVDLTKRIVTGFYNTALFFDSDCDVVMPGANNKSIAERGPNSSATQKIKHLMFHDWTMLPGKIQVLEERTTEIEGKKVTGTYFETKMADTQMGNDALINYQEKIYDNHSEGFLYMAGQYCENGSELWAKTLPLLLNPEDAEKCGFMFLWEELKMFEGSTVAFGANALTPFLGVKSENKEALLLKLCDRIDLLGKQFKSGTQSDDMMYQFKMQKKQIKQIINELFSLPPSDKDVVIDRHAKEEAENGFSVKSILNSL